MRYLALYLLLLVAACQTQQPLGTSANYRITEFAEDGSVKRIHQTTEVREKTFPPSVSFRDKNGVKRTVKGSFLVEIE